MILFREGKWEVLCNNKWLCIAIFNVNIRIDTHFADIHGLMNVALVGAICSWNCADESDVHKTMNASKVSVNPKLRSKIKVTTFELYFGIIGLHSSKLTHRQVEIIFLFQNMY